MIAIEQNLKVDKLNLAEIGPKFEHHSVFPARTNTGQILSYYGDVFFTGNESNTFLYKVLYLKLLFISFVELVLVKL